MAEYFKKAIYRTLYSKRLIKYLVNQKKLNLFLSLLNRKTHGRLLIKLSGLLRELQKEKVKQILDPNKKTVAIFCVQEAYKKHVGEIANRLTNKNYKVLFFNELGQMRDYEYEKQENVFYVLGNILPDIDFVDVLICVAHLKNLPQNIKKVLFVHDIHDSPPGDVDEVSRQTLQFEYLFLPSNLMINRLRQQIFMARDKFPNETGGNKKICLIPGGYVKLDENLEYFKKYKQDTDAIIYAPTIPTVKGLGDVESVTQHGEKIVGAILTNFTGFKLIFRPHPVTLNAPEVQNIARKYKNEPRFILDDNASFYMHNYAKAAIMITDMSGTAYTYAFTTLRPVVFFSPNEDKVMRRFGNYQYFIDRDKIGYVARNTDEMVDKIRLLLSNKDKFTHSIKEYRDSTVYNIGKAEDYFIENFDYIMENKKNPDWIYI